MTVQHIVLMGVAGSGKTVVGTALADALGWTFLEGDDFHPAENVAKMAAGQPLDDADRLPWLAALNEQLRAVRDRGEKGVLSCSALKQAYREALAEGSGGVLFVYLDVPKTVLQQRLERRPGHYMKADMLASQLAALEVPAQSEALWVDGTRSVEAIVGDIRSWLSEDS